MPATAHETTPPADDINITAEMLDQVIQARDETQETLRNTKDIYARLQKHQEAVTNRHEAILESLRQIGETVERLAAMVERNSHRLTVLEEWSVAVSQARLDYEDEFTLQHAVMQGWYKAQQSNTEALLEFRATLKRICEQLGITWEGVPIPQFEPLPVRTSRRGKSDLPPAGSVPHHYLVHGKKASSKKAS